MLNQFLKVIIIMKINLIINNLCNNNKRLTEKIGLLEKKSKEQEIILNSYNQQFKTLFIDCKITPTGLLALFQSLGCELIKFIDNFCLKYGLDYWLDYGSLLSAVRHEGFIPWDDDMDLGMMRKDFNKFMEVFDQEIMRFDLENNIKWSIDTVVSEQWVQSFIKIYYFNDQGQSLGGLDIFPYDFLKEKTEDFESLYYEQEYTFNKK